MNNQKGRIMTATEQKLVMLDLLKYFDNICRANNIKYSLIGGSLIGAVRHHGFIPWDDDIDLILMPEEYKKLIKVLNNNNNNKYRFLLPEQSNSYNYPFLKLIDTRTALEETKYTGVEDYGVYLDIFSYHYVSNNKFIRVLHYYGQIFGKKLFALMARNPKSEGNILNKILFLSCKLVPVDLVKKKYVKYCTNNSRTGYILSNWPAYGFKKEIQIVDDTKGYIDMEFEGVEAMVFENYDKILRTTFGDYMILPPEKERASNHDIKVWWKVGNNVG